MEIQYTYLRTDFPGSQYNTTALQNEIRGSNLSSKYLYINTFANNIYIFFNDDLDASEKNELDSIVANHDTSYGIVPDPNDIVGLLPIGEETDLAYGTPSPDPLPSLSTQFSSIFVYGYNGPNLSNVTTWSVTWNLNTPALNSFNLSTNNGNPSWWINLIPLSTHTFNQASPSLTLSGTNIANLDGQYWVNKIGADFVMVSKSGTFAIYLSNDEETYNPPIFKETFLLFDPISNGLRNSGRIFNVFGTHFQRAESLVEQTTTLRSYQNALVLNTTNLPKGRYRIAANFRYSLSVTNNQFYSRLSVNGDPIGDELITRIPNTANRWFNSFLYYQVIEGENEIILQYYGGNGTAAISDAVIELWRVE
jgi:hypothetical protein